MNKEQECKLEIALCSYLPYKVMTNQGQLIGIEVSDNMESDLYWIEKNGVVSDYDYADFKLALYPLFDLTKEYLSELNLDITDEIDLTNIKDGCGLTLHLPYRLHELLCSLHFDVYGLIEEGLALDINKLKK